MFDVRIMEFLDGASYMVIRDVDKPSFGTMMCMLIDQWTADHGFSSDETVAFAAELAENIAKCHAIMGAMER